MATWHEHQHPDVGFEYIVLSLYADIGLISVFLIRHWVTEFLEHSCRYIITA